MKKKICTCISLMLVSAILFSQNYKRNNVWTIGNIPVVKFDFNNILQIDTVINSSLFSTPYCLIKSSSSCISDTNGNLLFFSNGFIFYDYEGFAMDSGIYVNCPYGNVLANYYGASLFDQTSIILPKKGNTYYVFSTGMSDSVATNYLNHTWTEFDVLNYSVVDMDSNGGKGKVVQKNVVLADKQHYVDCALHSVKHSNGKDWWLIKADCENNRYLEYLVKEDTIMGPYYAYIPINKAGGFCPWQSEIVFSTNGTKMASSMYGNIDSISSTVFYDFNRVDIFNFDRCNGSITYERHYRVPYDTSSYPNYDIKAGICFSPDAKLLYMSNMYTLYQIDLEDTNKYNAQFIYGPDTLINYFTWYGGIGLAPNGKIYIGSQTGAYSISYIDKPNIKGLGCDFIPKGLNQSYTGLRSPPNMPNYGLGKDTSEVCWPLYSTQYEVGSEQVVVYPNPTSGKFQIKAKNPSATADKKELYNSVGQMVMRTKENVIDVSNLPSGVYYLRVGNQVVKVVVE